MTIQFAVLAHIPLKTGARCQVFQHKDMDDPALDVMTDFTQVRPITCAPDMLIDDGLEKMKTTGVRLLLVSNDDGDVIGLVTAKDIQGEKPIQLVHETGCPHSQLTISQIMTPLSAIEVLNMATVRNALIGHIVATLRDLGRQHTLVVDINPESSQQSIRGLFSSSQIGKQLGVEVSEVMSAANSLSEIHHELA